MKKIKQTENKKSKFRISFPAIKKEKIFLYFPLLLLITLLSLISIYNSSLKHEIDKNKVIFNKVPSFVPALYPVSSDVLSENSTDKNFKFASLEKNSFPEISAEGAIVIDDDSKVALFAKNENLRFSMASTTKIMTALTALDYFKLDDILTVKSASAEGAVVGFYEDDKLYFKDVLYGMLLPSGNDAALTIAENYPGGREEFIKKMNDKAVSLNLYNTHFSDSAGLIDDGDYTTVLELARLTSIAMQNKVIKEIVGTKHKVISTIDGNSKFVLNNLNKLLGSYGVEGGKTGYTEEAGDILAISKLEYGSDKKEHRIIIVVMKSEDRFEDTRRLLSSIDGKVNYVEFE